MFNAGLGHYLTYHHPSQDFFRRHSGDFDGLMVPLSIATVFRQGTGGFVLTLKKPYAIDPRTPLFQADFERRFIRLAHEEMALVHGEPINLIFRSRPLQPADFGPTGIESTAREVLQFQKEFAQSSADKVDKYAALLGEAPQTSYSGPSFLIPPYFRTASQRDPWYQVSLALAVAGADQKEDFRLAPVIHLAQHFPQHDFVHLVTDYSNEAFDGLIVFINDLQEYVERSAVLESYARLVVALADTNKPLFGLFGGYYTLLLRKLGLGCFSNAVGYGEYRDSGYHAGGQAVRRYYVPALHRYLNDTEAQSILDVVNDGWVRCGCLVCAAGPRITDLSNQQLLDHFLNARVHELHQVADETLTGLLDQLTETSQRLARHPAIPQERYNHLNEWVAALRTFA